MALTPRLEIRQSQSLTLTPQLMQSIRLLQLSHVELNSFVEEEMLRNPLLEREEHPAPDAGATAEGIAAERDGRARDGSSMLELVEAGQQLLSATRIAQDMDTDTASLFPEQVGQDSLSASMSPPAAGPGGGGGADAPQIDQYVASRITLSDHLAEQVCLMVDDPGDRLIARNLIDSLDDQGYLRVDCATIARQLGATPEQVEGVLKRVQGCEPAGIFARDLRECLMLQLADRDRLDPMMQALLDNLELVGTHDFDRLMQRTGASAEDLRGMLAEIRELDPRPGRAFDGAPLQAVVPDVFVREGPDGGWQIELNTEVLPRVLVNRTYYASVSRQARGPKEKEFLVDCLQTANWLTKSLDQRAQTILKVAREIVSQQDGFFAHGIAHLRPMTLKNVADAIQMHESTVSRVTSNKYMATPRGLFEMKYFFTTALGSSEGGDTHSAESVRHFIQKMIEGEEISAILSDDTIAERLEKEHGINVARRTVAKYREGLNIPSSVVRRRQKKAAARER